MTSNDANFRNKTQPRSLMARGIDALSRREYSRRELKERLQRDLPQGQNPADVEDVLDALEQKKFLSDERYARSRVRMRSARYGNRRLAYELSVQGVDSETIELALQEAPDEFERAWEAWRRRFGRLPEDFKEKARQTRFLTARGFGFDMIERVFEKAREEAGKDDYP